MSRIVRYDEEFFMIRSWKDHVTELKYRPMAHRNVPKPDHMAANELPGG
jgi:hypothetical protein